MSAFSARDLEEAISRTISAFETGELDHNWQLRQHRYFLQTSSANYRWISFTEILRKMREHWPRQSGPDVSAAYPNIKALGYSVISQGDAAFNEYWEDYAAYCSDLGTSPSGRQKKPPKARTLIVKPSGASPTKEDITNAFAKLDAKPDQPGFRRPKSWYVFDPASGKEYPLKPVWGLAAGQRGKDFINSRQLRSKLESLGFPCVELGPTDFPDQIDEKEPLLLEGIERQATRVVKERSAAARKLCIEHYRLKNQGRLACVACGLDFSETYGQLGEGFIHVHHLNPLAEAKEVREISPKSELVPVCPNCHAMIHRNGENRSIADIRHLLKRE